MQKTLSARLPIKAIGVVALSVICFDPGQTHAQASPNAACTTARGTVARACFIGEYSLTKDAETGASLVLGADNRFQWYYSEPAGRKYATGRWQVRTGGVILTPDQPDPTAAVFELMSQEAWDETAETRLRLQQRDAAQALAEANCPVFVGNAIRSSEPPERAVPSDVATKNAIEALAQSLAAKGAYERAVAQAVAGPSTQKALLTEAAERARNVWIQSGFKTERTYQIAGLPVPALGQPNLPAVCTVPKMIYPQDVPGTAWLRGISININNAGSRFLVSEVKATLTYATGRVTTLKTNTSGLAFALFDPRQRVTSVDLSVDTPSKRTGRFSITPIAQGVINFTVNGDLLDGPPFGQLSLTKVGRALVSTGYMPGRYERVSDDN
jgi:hypothetical protein